MTQNLLFAPIRIGKLELSGRMVKSATLETRCTDDGFVTDELIEYYEQIARGGTPLLITGNAYFNPESKAADKQLAADHDNKIPGLRLLTDAVQRHGVNIFMQIYHVGRQAVPRLVGRKEVLAPSPVLEPTLLVRPRSITREEIRDTVKGFADMAERAQKSDFNGVQIHAAHGYLISEFLTPHTNRRKDEYGGSFDNRIRFLIEIYQAVRERVGADYPVIMKINGSDDLPFRNGLEPDDLVKIAHCMEAEGMDAVEITAGHYESGFTFERGKWKGFFSAVTSAGIGKKLPWYHRWGVRMAAPVMDWGLSRISAYREGFNLDYAKRFKQVLNIPVICVGGFAHRKAMERAIADKECDMVSVARALIADPFLYRHMKEGIEGPRCDFCNACYARGATWPVDCYNEEVRAKKDRMLAGESA